MSLQLTLKEGKNLIELARKTVDRYLTTGSFLERSKGMSPKLLERHGVFVTINSLYGGKMKLRGCIGYPFATTPLAQAVMECAISSATSDPRFLPLSIEDLGDVVFEISILTNPKEITVEKPTFYPSRIRVGEDGLLVEKGLYKGLLLPQVAVESNWDEKEFLSHCCMKAGLPPDCWLMNATKVYTFQCILITELSPGGSVEMKGPELFPDSFNHEKK